MHDVLVRVGEFVEHMATFSLEPPIAPKTMMGTPVGILELRLQHCVASLKTLAPTLPPLLFPRRLSRLAAEYSEVRDSSTIVFSNRLRESLMKEQVQLLTLEDVPNNKYAESMKELTKQHVRQVEASFLFVDISCFLEMNTNEKIQFSAEKYRDVVAAIEECIYQFNGILHSVSADKVVGVWNVDQELKNYCEQAATCGLVLASRLQAMRRQNKALSEHLPVRIGVVAGTVTFGIFGDAQQKVLELFGPPLLKGIIVARANAFHATTVSCDETVRRNVEKIFLCKPIEIVDDGDVVYEVIHEASRKEADLESQLSVYNKAFELFQRKYYREALRAFRTYTKLYGYDSSVERIQSIITGM
jgi:class 3 adenylate cyclase